MAAGGSAGVRLTSRDEDWLRWLGRWPWASVEQIGRYAGMSGQVARRRVRAARSLGVVDTARLLNDAPTAVWLTREGMKLVGLSGPVVEPKVAQFRHDLMLIDLADWLLKEKPTHELVTEREMRRTDTVNQNDNHPPTYAVLRLSEKSRQRIYPDLMTITQSGTQLAHELEYSRKDFGRLKRLMGAYANTERIGGVRYYCLPAALGVVTEAADEVNKKVATLGMQKRIFVESWTQTNTTPSGEYESTGARQ